jgi:Trypsin-like peptidase domain
VVLFSESKNGEVITESKHYRTNYKTLAIPAKVVYESVRLDMAVLQLDRLPAGIKPLELATNRCRPGQLVHFVGNSTERFGCVFSYNQGYVRNAFRWDDMGANVVATQAPLNKGDSGGPMLNSLGEVVGFAFMSTTGGTLPKTSAFHDMQVTALSMCVSEIREALQEMRLNKLAKQSTPAKAVPTQLIKAATHSVFMEKDMTHSITVAGEGFIPDVRVDGNLLSPVGAPGKESQYLFTPKESKVHRIQVSHYPGREVGKGTLPYTLQVAQVGAYKSDTTVKAPQLKTNEHVRKFEAGKSYQITVRGKGFEPDLQVLDGGKSVAAKLYDGLAVKKGTDTRFEVTLMFSPPKTTDYRMLVGIGPFSPSIDGPLDYTLDVAEQSVHFAVKDRLTVKEPRKTHAVKLEAGKTYQIDLNTNEFDSKLALEDGDGKVLRTGNDFGEFGARLFFSPAKSDTYRIAASSGNPNIVGQYSVTVVEAPTQP